MSHKNTPPYFLIVDDESLARTELRRQIGTLLPSYITVEAENICQARERLLQYDVDGVFLDLEMPEGNGMTLLSEIRAMGVPVVITTAHEQYAAAAFDGDVVDYLLKPFDKERLARAIARIRQPIPEIMTSRLLVLGDQSTCWPVLPEEIVMVTTEGPQVRVHLKDRESILFSANLKEIELQLDPSLFVRVNRSQIVQLHCLKQIYRSDGLNSFEAELVGHGLIAFSRRQSQAFRARFGF